MEIDLFGNVIQKQQEYEVNTSSDSPFIYMNNIANKKYLAGDEPDESITEIFPDMSAGDREMLISHTCEDCWDKFFG